MTRQVNDNIDGNMVSSSRDFFSKIFILYLIFVLADTPTNPQPTQRVKTAMAATAAAVVARDATHLELLVCFII